MWGFLLILVFSYSSVQAAQDARVVNDDAKIYSNPDFDSDVLDRIEKGQILRVSEENRDGWFKVVLPMQEGKRLFGWMRSDDLSGDTLKQDLTAAGIQRFSPVVAEPTIRQLVFYAYGGLGYLSPFYPNSNLTGQGITSYYSFYFGGEVGFRFDSSWTLFFDYHRLSYSYLTVMDGVLATYGVASNNLLFLVEGVAIYEKPYKMGIVLGLGASIGSTATLTTPTTQETTLAVMHPVGVFKVVNRYYFTEGLAVALGIVAEGAALGSSTGTSGLTADFGAWSIGADLGIHLEL